MTRSPLTAPSPPRVEIRRSARRRRTVSARLEGDTMIVQVPTGLTMAEEQTWVDTMLTKLQRRQARRRPGDDDLRARAADLSRRFLDGHAVASSVRWVDNQHTRWGSCTMADRTIRLSRRLQGMPAYVVDYVLVHELSHLLVPHHGPEFWAWVERYPRTERARGYLEGASLSPDCGRDDR